MVHDPAQGSDKAEKNLAPCLAASGPLRIAEHGRVDSALRVDLGGRLVKLVDQGLGRIRADS